MPTKTSKKADLAADLAASNALTKNGNGTGGTKLPRATCPTCGSDVALRRGGEFREHQDPSTKAKCANSGTAYVAGPEGGTIDTYAAPDTPTAPDDDQAVIVTELKLDLRASELADRRPGGAWSDAEAIVLEHDRLEADPDNPVDRVDPTDEELIELAQSIAVLGVLEPIVVRPADDNGIHRIVFGHRRWAAARMAGVPIPALVRKDYVHGNELAEVAAIVENLHRKNLTPIQEAHAFERLRKGGMKQADIALAAGINQGTVSKRLALLKLPVEVQAKVADKTLDASVAVELAKAPKEAVATAVKAIERGARPDAAVREATREAELDQLLEAAVTEETKAGNLVVDLPPTWGGGDEDDLLPLIDPDSPTSYPDGVSYSRRGLVDVAPDDHATCPGHAVAVGLRAGKVLRVLVCTDPKRHGPTTSDKRDAANEANAAEREAERAAAAAAAEAERAARRAAVQAVASAKVARPAMLDHVTRWVLESLLAPDDGDEWFPGQMEARHTLELLGVDPPAIPDGIDWDARHAIDAQTADDLRALTTGDKDAALRVAFVGCLAAGESLLGQRDRSWRLLAAHFAVLVAHGGYTMTDADTQLTAQPAPPAVATMPDTIPDDAVAWYAGNDTDDPRFITDVAEAHAIVENGGDVIWVGDGVNGALEAALARPTPEAVEENQTGEHPDTTTAAAADAEPVTCTKSGKLLPSAKRGPAALCPVCLQAVGTDASGKLIEHVRPGAAVTA